MEKNYFTRELQGQINEMSSDQMNALLLELEGTAFWIAILKYLQQRMTIAQNGLITTDPIVKATEMCRIQGNMMGLSDLQSMVIVLKEQSEKNMPEKITKKE